MIDLVKFEAKHMISLIENGVIECGIRAESNDYVRNIAKERESEGTSMTGIEDGTILGCYGVDELWPGVGEFWAMFSPAIKDRSMEVCRLIASEVDRMAAKFHRVQCHVRTDFFASLRMIQFLKFEEECICRKYTQDGSDCFQYSRVA